MLPETETADHRLFRGLVVVVVFALAAVPVFDRFALVAGGS
jgi:hypothetical protein